MTPDSFRFLSVQEAADIFKEVENKYPPPYRQNMFEAKCREKSCTFRELGDKVKGQIADAYDDLQNNI